MFASFIVSLFIENNYVNADIKRMLCTYLDRQAVTALSLTCKSFRRAILSSPLKAALIPTMSSFNRYCPLCHSGGRAMTRSYTCGFGHEVKVHHPCFKRQVLGPWQRNLEQAMCLIPNCGAPITEYGKDASKYQAKTCSRFDGCSLLIRVGRAIGARAF